MAQELKTKIALCAIRTVGGLLAFVLFVWMIRLLEIDYTDVRTVLGFVNAYFPELVAIGIFIGAGYAFYKTTVSPATDFHFIHFFMNDQNEDIWKLGYFLLLLVAMWLLFTLLWRDRLTVEYLLSILGVFVAKNGIDTIGKAFGKSRQPTKEDTP